MESRLWNLNSSWQQSILLSHLAGQGHIPHPMFLRLLQLSPAPFLIDLALVGGFGAAAGGNQPITLRSARSTSPQINDFCQRHMAPPLPSFVLMEQPDKRIAYFLTERRLTET